MSRFCNLILAIIGLIVLSPLFIIIPILIKIKMPGSVFFFQERVGLNEDLFTIIKFRSMIINNSNNTITTKDDSRITPFGQFLRRTKLDEIPQLFNIIKGEMNFVGPRPDTPEILKILSNEEKTIFTVRPGLTGLDSLKFPYEEELLAKQANPKEFYSKVIFPTKVRLNIRYTKTRSELLDLKLIMKTINLLLRNYISTIFV